MAVPQRPSHALMSSLTSSRRVAQALCAAALACAACGSPSGAGAQGAEEPRAGSTETGAESPSPEASSPETTSPETSSPEAEQLQAPPQQPQTPPPADTPRVARARELFAQGMQAYQANDFERAATLLTQVDAVIPSPELAYNIAYCYQRMSEPERAVRFYRRYLETGHPTDAERTDVESRIALMEALRVRQHDLTMTLPPTMDAMAADAGALFDSGRQMFQRRRYAAALQAFSAAAAAFQALNVEVPELVYNLAVTSERLESMDDAADYYDEYLRQRPQDPEADRIRARVRQLRERRR